jgi:glycosyltransferase involved in cell wall biosynthesis
MENMSAQNDKIHVIHNPRNLGLGGAYKRGIAAAKFDYVMMVPGDNEHQAAGMMDVLSAVGKADIVIPYVINPQIRSYFRRFISFGFTALINLLFGLRVRYYNGLVIHRADLLRQISITTDGSAFQPEVLVKLLKRRNSYVEVGTIIDKCKAGKSKIFQPKNLLSVMRTILHLARIVYFQG